MVLTPKLGRKTSKRQDDEVPLEMMENIPELPSTNPQPNGNMSHLGPNDNQPNNQTRSHSIVDIRQEEKSFQDFVRQNLKQRSCCTYVPVQDMAEKVCHCGSSEEEHLSRGIFPPTDINASWTPKQDTKLTPTTAFGEILFSGFGRNPERSCPYVRVDSKTSVSALWELLHKVWKLPPPKLIISVTGGAKRLFIKPRLKNAFKQGLIDVASTTDAWIISGGTGTGVMKYVGEALHEYQLSSGIRNTEKRMVAIGIASWGCIDNNEALDDMSGEGVFPAIYNLRDCTAKGAKKRIHLDHNHSHFILVDNGTVGKFGVEIELRSELESLVAMQSAGSIKDRASATSRGQKTPVILIVCEGGANTLEQTRNSVEKHMPVVVIKYSGRAADVIATGYQLSRPTKSKDHHQNHHPHPMDDDKSDFGKQNFDEDMELQMREAFNLDPTKPQDNKRIAECLINLKAILSKRSLITIFELDDSTCRDMDKAVLSALLKAKKSDPQSQVDLALIWNRADIARMRIFTLENRNQWQHLALEDAMHNALVQGRVEFVQLFMDNGVHLGNFLTPKRLRDLYKDSFGSDKAPITIIVNSLRKKIKVYDKISRILNCNKVSFFPSDEATLLEEIGTVIRFLLDDNFAHPYEASKFVISEETQSSIQPVGSVTSQRHTNSTLLSGSLRKTRTRLSGDEIRNPANHLFLWSLLLNKLKLAKMFWNIIDDPMGGALVASHLLKSLADEADKHEEIDLSSSLSFHARIYEELASNVLGMCYRTNKEMSHLLLRRELSTWGGTTLFSLAEAAELMDFMQLSCCQTMLTQLWYGDIQDMTRDWKIMVVTVLPVLVPLIKFKGRDTEWDSWGAEEEEERKTNIGEDKNIVKKRWSVGIMPFRRTPKTTSTTITPFSAWIHFYNAPVTKFYVNTLYYLVFLCLFTFVSLAELRPFYSYSTQGVAEIVIWAWIATMSIEDSRQIMRREAKSILFKLWNHLSSFWNQIQAVTVCLVVAAIVLRVQGDKRELHSIRVIYAVAVLLAYLRIMEAFYVSKTIGPKIIMIQKMLKDLLFFVCILAIFILGFGVAMQAILHPHKKFSLFVVLEAVYVPYWQIFGELFMDHIEAKDQGECVHLNSTEVMLHEHSDDVPCPQKTILVPILAAIYMMLTNVLLLNLLIAMFSHTFQMVQDNSEKVWRFHRYSVIRRYYDAPALPPPLIILAYLRRMFQKFRARFHMKRNQTDRFKKRFKLEENNKLSAFENAGRDRYLAFSQKAKVELLETKITTAGERIEQVVEELEDIKEWLGGEKQTLNVPSNVNNLPAGKLSQIEEKVNQQTLLMKELIAIARGVKE